MVSGGEDEPAGEDEAGDPPDDVRALPDELDAGRRAGHAAAATTPE
jgi:hypothetical protein